MSNYNFLFDNQDILMPKSGINRIAENEYPDHYDIDTENYSSLQDTDSNLEPMSTTLRRNPDNTSDDLNKHELIELAQKRLQKGLSFLEDDINVLNALNVLVDELNSRKDSYLSDVDPSSQIDVVEEPDWVSRISHYKSQMQKIASKISPVGNVIDYSDKYKTELISDFENWLESEGKLVPSRFSEDWLDYFEEYIEATGGLSDLMLSSSKIRKKF